MYKYLLEQSVRLTRLVAATAAADAMRRPQVLKFMKCWNLGDGL